MPDDQTYLTPMFSADHKWLHLEARYDYEDLRTASLWAGYNFHVGETVTLVATPMFGVVFGRTNAVVPGYKISLTWKRLNFSPRRNRSPIPLTELVYSPRDWFHAGFALQHTRAGHAPVEPGGSFGIVHGRWDFTTYVFNVGTGRAERGAGFGV